MKHKDLIKNKDFREKTWIWSTHHHLPAEVDSVQEILPEVSVRDSLKNKSVYVLWNDVQVAVNLERYLYRINELMNQWMINGHISSNRHCSVYLFVCSFTQNEKSNHQKSRNNEKKMEGARYHTYLLVPSNPVLERKVEERPNFRTIVKEQ